MHHGGPAARGRRTYLVPDTAVADLIDLLWASGELKDLDAEGRVLLGRAASSAEHEPAVVLRMRLSQNVARISIARDGKTPDVLQVAATGRVEELLATLGFHPVRRSATLRYVFALDGVQVEVLQEDPPGWSCVLTFESFTPEAFRAVERRLGLETYAPVPAESVLTEP